MRFSDFVYSALCGIIIFTAGALFFSGNPEPASNPTLSVCDCPVGGPCTCGDDCDCVGCSCSCCGK